MERKTLLGFNIDTYAFNDALNYAKNLIRQKQGGQIVTINPEMIELGAKNPEFVQIVNNSALVIPDGIGIKIGFKILGVNVPRIPGIEFSRKMLEECAKNNYTVALIGAKPEILEKTVNHLKEEIKDLNIVYARNGYFYNKEEILKELGEKAPQFVLVALGTPKQEEFIAQARKILPQSVMIGVGGSFDVWSGKVKRAPKIYQKLGIEWLYRAIKDPKRLKRIFPNLPRFVFRVIFTKK